MRLLYLSPLLYVLPVCILWLTGCAATPAKSDTLEPEALVTHPFISNNAPEKPTELYQHTDSASLFDQNRQRLQAIESFIQAGDGDTAKRAADAINPDDLSFEQRAQLSLFYAQILLSFGEAERAVERLNQIQSSQLNQDERIKYFQSLAFAYSLTGNVLEGAKSRIAMHALLTTAIEREKNQAAIIEALRLLPDTSLQTFQTDVTSGWMRLAAILKAINQPDFNAQLNLWRTTFPNHPADLKFLDQPVDMAIETTKSEPISIPNNIPVTGKTLALILPGSGNFASAGKAIRAGFMAALDRADKASRPIIHFYDSEIASPQVIYNQAVAEGAQLIIGPLAKEQIQSLVESVSFTVPVLALNHIPGLQKDQLYQFSLSPLDDVEQLTRKAWNDGHRNVLILVPENAQGKRIAGYLSESWKKQGGSVLDTQTYNPKETDFSATVQKLLQLDLTSTPPKRRQDVDAILLSAYSNEARSINPQLQFYGAGDLPVYAMPTVFSGQINPTLDADLNKITFCDTPWLFSRVYQGDLSMSGLQDIWKPFSSAYLRLIAMGIDAFQLATRSDNLTNIHLAGATGDLSLTTDQRIRRELTCARFINGQPETGAY